MVDSTDKVILSALFLHAIDLVSEIIGFTADVFLDMYKDVSISDDYLARQATDAVSHCAGLLNVDDEEYSLVNLLNFMVTNAPHINGMRFVSVAIILAYKHHKVFDLAKSLMENFALALLTRSSTIHKDISEPVVVGSLVRGREQDHCAITKYFDDEKVFSVPRARRKSDMTSYLSVEYFIPIPPSNMSTHWQLEFAYNVLWAWSGLTEEDWDKNIYSEENALLVASEHRGDHRYMMAYFEPKEGIPNAYTARKIRGFDFFTGDASFEVVFDSWSPIIIPPDPRFVKVHRALVQLVDSSGAIDTLLARKRKLAKIEEVIDDIEPKEQGLI
ncbi:hypothetical protein CPC08DRAFT_819839 [Agrocybe pediades]|nr:hypothetical protein CPC08DRAFT_819839 [Agrocybe pediades]